MTTMTTTTTTTQIEKGIGKLGKKWYQKPYCPNKKGTFFFFFFESSCSIFLSYIYIRICKKKEQERSKNKKKDLLCKKKGNLVDPASSHMLLSRTKPCKCQRNALSIGLRMAHYNSNNPIDCVQFHPELFHVDILAQLASQYVYEVTILVTLYRFFRQFIQSFYPKVANF